MANNIASSNVSVLARKPLKWTNLAVLIPDILASSSSCKPKYLLGKFINSSFDSLDIVIGFTLYPPLLDGRIIIFISLAFGFVDVNIASWYGKYSSSIKILSWTLSISVDTFFVAFILAYSLFNKLSNIISDVISALSK